MPVMLALRKLSYKELCLGQSRLHAETLSQNTTNLFFLEEWRVLLNIPTRIQHSHVPDIPGTSVMALSVQAFLTKKTTTNEAGFL